MSWIVILFFAAAVLIVVRIYFKVRNIRNMRKDDWDARAIDRLRKQGSDPFSPHEVDFFFALPTEEACRVINGALEKEGYALDVKAVEESTILPFSLHARKSMRLSVPDMQALSRRFKDLAASQGGRYDGWAADVVK